MATYRAYIANCPILGERYSMIGTSRFLNVIKLRLGQFDLRLEEKPEIITHNFSNFKGQTIHTTDLYINGIRGDQLRDAEEIASEVASLLSLATCSTVVKYGYEFNDGQPEKILHSPLGQLMHFCPLIDTKNGSSVRKFLELTWSTYHALKGLRKLDIALQYFVWAQRNETPIELNLVTTFVLFENLKHTFAIQQGYPFINGYFRIHGATTSNARTKSFKDLLQEMFRVVRMAPRLDSIINLRNDLIHSGVSQLNLQGYLKIYEECHDILREYLLRLLNYIGPYFPFSSPNKANTISS